MPKIILYLIILLLLGVVGYLLFQEPIEARLNRLDMSNESVIEVSKPTITDSAPKKEDKEEARPETVTETESQVAVTGSLNRFIERDNSNGVLTVYALIDDGTEFIEIDMSQILKPGVLSPEDQLGLKLGQTVTITGILKKDLFIAVKIE